MISRYTLPEMDILWSEKSKFHHWLQVELAVVQALGDLGRLPKKTVRNILERADFDLARIDAIEREVRHDMIAFLSSVAEHVGEDARHIHVGMTSSDVLDSALATMSLKAFGLIMLELDKLSAAVKEKALLYRDAPCMGRTNCVHDEPTTLGLKLASWSDELKRTTKRVPPARRPPDPAGPPRRRPPEPAERAGRGSASAGRKEDDGQAGEPAGERQRVGADEPVLCDGELTRAETERVGDGGQGTGDQRTLDDRVKPAGERESKQPNARRRAGNRKDTVRMGSGVGIT